MAILTNHVQRTRGITSSTDKRYSLDSEDDFRSGCRNVSHQQQFFSELHSPGQSHYTNYWYSWVQTIYWIFVQLQPQLFLFNNNNYSTSIMHSDLITYLLLWQRFRKFPDIQNIVIQQNSPSLPPNYPKRCHKSLVFTESAKLMQVKSSTILLKTHLSSYEALSQQIKAFFSLIDINTIRLWK